MKEKQNTWKPQMIRLAGRRLGGVMLMVWLMIAGPPPATAQSNVRVRGQILDGQTREPLSGALVEVLNAPYLVTTDADGFFFLSNIPPGLISLKVSKIAYRSAVISPILVSEGTPVRVVISLKPEAIVADTVSVVARRMSQNLAPRQITTIRRPEIEQRGSLGIASLLQGIAGLQVESPGGEGGGSRITIHGSRSSQVLVLLDGQRLNNPQDGEVDLSQIPLDQIDRIEIATQGNSALYGNQAFAGVISFHTRKVMRNLAGISAGTGRFGYAAGKASVDLSDGRWKLMTHYRQDYARQNFPYSYRETIRIRRNAYFRNKALFLKLQYRNSRAETAVLFSRGQSIRGLPSPYFDEYRNYGAYLDRVESHFILSQRFFPSSRWYLEWSAGQHDLRQMFDNERDPVVYTRYRNRQKNRTQNLQLRLHLQPGDRFFLNAGSEYLREYLEGQDLLFPGQSMGQHTRQSAAIFGSLEWRFPAVAYLWRQASLLPAWRLQKYFNEPAIGYPAVNLRLTPWFTPAVSLFASAARSVRYPDFNSLFWAGDVRASGNPELAPEKNTSIVWGGAFQSGRWFLPRIHLSLFHNRIRDLIVWQRGVNGIWSPRNLLKVDKRGYDLNLEQTIIRRRLTLTLNYSRMEALNRSGDPLTEGKKVVFVPPNVWNITLVYRRGGLQGMLVHRRVGPRETVPANSRGTRLPAYRLWDVSLSVSHRIHDYLMTFTVTGKNILKENYQLIFGYPMPGQDIRVSIQLKKQFRKGEPNA